MASAVYMRMPCLVGYEIRTHLANEPGLSMKYTWTASGVIREGHDTMLVSLDKDLRFQACTSLIESSCPSSACHDHHAHHTRKGVAESVFSFAGSISRPNYFK